MKININKYWVLGITALFIGSIAFGLYYYKWEYRKPIFDIYFFSLTRGRAIFIRTPENKTILIGGGQNSGTIREITKVTPFYRRKIDYLIVPSAVPAQIGGLIEIIDRYEIGEVIMAKFIATSTALTALQKKITKNKIHLEEVGRGDEVTIENSLTMDVLFPYEGFKFNKTSLPELGLSVSFGSTTVYLIGNLSKTVQKDILKNISIKEGENVIEFYNSAASSKVSNELLEKLNPKYIFSTKEKSMHLISVGEKWTKED